MILRSPAVATLWRCLCLLLSVSSPALRANEPFAGTDDKWRHFTSPNFELYSRVDEVESRAVLRQLEVLRATFLQTLELKEKAPAPVTIFYFGHVRDFRAYLREELRKNESYRASFHSDPDRGVMVLAPLASADVGHQLALSSYVGHLFRTSGERPPQWLAHGFSTLFETLALTDEKVLFGRPSPGRVRVLQEEKLMPLDALLGIEPGNELFANERATRLYFAQTWAVVHYWMLGKHQFPQDRVSAFLRYSRGQRDASVEERRQVFEHFFGVNYAEMNRAIDSYVVSGRYNFTKLPMPAIAPPSGYTRRAVSRGEIRLRLGELALRTVRSPAGRLALLQALSENPGDVRVLETLGAVALEDHEPGVARDRWIRAFEAGSNNPAIIQHLARLESRGWFQQFDYYSRLPAEKAERLRDLLQRSIAAAPAQSEAYELLAWVEAFAPEPFVPNVNLVQGQFPTLDDRAHTLLALALVRLRLGDRETGLKLLEDVERLSPTPRTLRAVEMTRAILEGRPPRRLAETIEENVPIRLGTPQFTRP